MRATGENSPSFRPHFTRPHRAHLRRKKFPLLTVSFIIVVTLALASHRPARAQDNIDGGKAEPFPDAIIAYRLGNYYLVIGDYERAIEYLSRAIALIPEEVFAIETAYADIYWALGEAEERSGLYAQALFHYQRFLDLAGDEAAPWTQQKVQTLRAQLRALA
ncbi:MAG: tetratricopeptide repeat protein [Chloroflexi bacterium]|nr:tetratricopeptide repeat protein [Chloroflexota bacterium]